jgi:hypothetical protein
MRKMTRKILLFCTAMVILYLLLLIPDRQNNNNPALANHQPFVWQKDSLWLKLENDFRQAKNLPAQVLDSALVTSKNNLLASFHAIENKNISATDSSLFALQDHFFALAPMIAVRQNELGWYTAIYNQLRNYIKLQSQQWDMNAVQSRNAVYTSLYGMRAAVEEVMLQADSSFIPQAVLVREEPSATPAVNLLGITLHSGDMLVSRGGAEVSALISRGNDYPGNFSHVAFLYIDEKTKMPWLVEAHIEKGVAVSSLEDYLKDKKLRIMAMRPRANLLEIMKDSMLPHKAAKAMYTSSFQRHIPYDFKMNFYDSSQMFCSEVASFGYKMQGLQLWQAQSTISSKGVVNWLQDFGVENFVTQMPSDLEYDPQLSVVAEWRDPETLFKDHLDNAVMDAMLTQANEGERIGYNTWLLPLVRVVKGYCMVKNYFGAVGLIPEGMSATRALKNQEFVAMNKVIKDQTVAKANTFMQENKYRAPYWQLVRFAEECKIAGK